MADATFIFYDLNGKLARLQPDPPPTVPPLGTLYGDLKTGNVYEYLGPDAQGRHVYRQRQQSRLTPNLSTTVSSMA